MNLIPTTRIDRNFQEIMNLIEPKSSVLDLGCGPGTLLKKLIVEKNVLGRGIDINEENVIQSIEKGISVSRGNIDQGLFEYNDASYDYVILSRTLQVLHRPDFVIDEMLRVGKKAIVSFPNFANWKVRFKLLFSGKMPKTSLLPHEWYNTPNIHSLSISDFRLFCKKRNITILREILLVRSKKVGKFRRIFANFFAEEGIYLITR